MKKNFIIIYILLNSPIVLANTTEEFFTQLKNSKFSLAIETAKKIQHKLTKQQLLFYVDITYNNDYTNEKILSISYEYNSLENNLNLINRGLIQYLKNGNEIKARKILKQAFFLALERKDKILAAESLKLTLEIYQRFASIIEDYSYEYILNEYKKVLYDNFERRNYLLKTIKLKYRSHKNKDIEVLNLLKKHRLELEQYNDNSKFLDAKIQIELSTISSNLKQNLIESKRLLLNAINNIETIENGIFEKERLISAKINLAINAHKEGHHKSAIEILEKLDIKNDNYMHKLIKQYKLYWLSESHKEIGNELTSCKYYNEYQELAIENDQSNKAQQNSELETKYQTAEKEKQILLEQQKNRQTKNIALGLAGLLLSGSLIFFLIQKNTKRKQLLAEQEKELQVQKVGTLMKEQELASIDAMIAGQEKERQRIANDLHDDLGGMMATVKLHFNTLKDKPSSELFDKTDHLLDEAYQKVRSIAHAKNSGVIAKEGLLKSVEDMAQKVSASNKLQIEVVHHGLNNRLENSLELTIFRIIQELITNVIKHANATETIIHLTQHEYGLNIMVEDNGKGFNPKRIVKKQSMGISSIDKRVDHLDGSMNIESEMHKGTTIIIDIPI